MRPTPPKQECLNLAKWLQGSCRTFTRIVGTVWYGSTIEVFRGLFCMCIPFSWFVPEELEQLWGENWRPIRPIEIHTFQPLIPNSIGILMKGTTVEKSETLFGFFSFSSLVCSLFVWLHCVCWIVCLPAYFLTCYS